MKAAILTILLLMASSSKGESIPQTLHWVHFDVQGSFAPRRQDGVLQLQRGIS